MGEATHSNLYVRNLTAEVDEGLLQRFFSPFGQIESCRIVKNARTQASKGYGFVKFGSVESAQDAIAQLNGTACAGSLLEVKFADADAGRQGSGMHTHPSCLGTAIARLGPASCFATACKRAAQHPSVWRVPCARPQQGVYSWKGASS